ncbi:IS3 family transposase [Kitasatospora sp. NBC_00070]|uniref:IS3 family transposase n=1 Tax=Kitasatospora sp. NBC_00070 TaxID=2975962 RepID=UPI0038601288
MLDLSPSTHSARKTRPKPPRQLRDEELIALVTAVWEESGRTYGARRITRALVRDGRAVARCTVERLMHELGIEGTGRARSQSRRPLDHTIADSTKPGRVQGAQPLQRRGPKRSRSVNALHQLP